MAQKKPSKADLEEENKALKEQIAALKAGDAPEDATGPVGKLTTVRGPEYKKQNEKDK